MKKFHIPLLACPLLAITSSTVSLAACNQSKSEYTITFKAEDGTVLQTSTVKRGETPVYDGNIPFKKGIVGEKYYLFKQWEPALGPAHSNQTYTPKFIEITNGNDTDRDGLVDDIDPEISNNIYKDAALQQLLTITTDIQIDYDWLLKGDNTKFDPHLAKLAILNDSVSVKFNDSLFDSEKYGSDKPFVNAKHAIFSRLGCGDIQTLVMTPDMYETEKNDITQTAMAHHIINNPDGTKKDVIFLTIRGTNNANEWCSNLDFGSNDSSYEAVTGQHPLWTNTAFHKGFYVTANRVLGISNEPKECQSNFLDYVEQHSKHGEPIIFISGHSRGAAIGEIIGWYMEKIYPKTSNVTPKTFTYTTGSPTVVDLIKTASDDDYKTKTIFNVINNDDAVPKLPLKKWNMTRFGTTHDAEGDKDALNFSIANTEKAAEDYEALTGLTYYNLVNIDSILEYFPYNIRNQLYNPEKNDVNLLQRISESMIFETQKDAENKWNEIKTVITDTLKISENFYNHEIVQDANGYELKVYVAFSASCQILSNIFEKKYDFETLFDVLKNFEYVLTEPLVYFAVSLVTSIIFHRTNPIGGALLPHDYGSYILIVDKAIKG